MGVNNMKAWIHTALCQCFRKLLPKMTAGGYFVGKLSVEFTAHRRPPDHKPVENLWDWAEPEIGIVDVQLCHEELKQ